MKITRLVTGAFALLLLLLPLRIVAQRISVETFDCTYTHDYGQVEVGGTSFYTFTVLATVGPLEIIDISLEGSSAFEITDITTTSATYPNPPYLFSDETLGVEVAFSPESVGEHTAILKIVTDANNTDENECDPWIKLDEINYILIGTGVDMSPADLMNDLIDFFNEAVEDEEIVGVGATTGAAKAHLRVFDNMLDSALAYIEGGEFEQACNVLEKALLRSDAATPDRPKDFIGGPEAPSLNSMILEVMTALGC